MDRDGRQELEVGSQETEDRGQKAGESVQDPKGR